MNTLQLGNEKSLPLILPFILCSSVTIKTLGSKTRGTIDFYDPAALRYLEDPIRLTIVAS